MWDRFKKWVFRLLTSGRGGHDEFYDGRNFGMWFGAEPTEDIRRIQVLTNARTPGDAVIKAILLTQRLLEHEVAGDRIARIERSGATHYIPIIGSGGIVHKTEGA